MPELSTRIKVHKGFSKKKVMMYGFTLNDLEILDWIEQLVTRNEGIKKGKAMFTRNLSEHPGLNQDSETHIYYWVDKPENVGETFRYYMINYDKMMADMCYIATDQRTYSHYLDRLCGTKDCKNPDLVYPLSKIVRHTRFGKKSFFCVNPAVVIYLREEADNMNDLFDGKPEPVTDLPKKEHGPLSRDFLSFYKKACTIFEFPHKLPKDGESPSAILSKSQEYYESILAGTFLDRYPLKDKYDCDLSGASAKKILLALDRYVDYLKANNRPMKISLDTFFYNPKTLYSACIRNYDANEKDRVEKIERGSNKEFLDTSDYLGFQELWRRLCLMSYYPDIDNDKVVHNSFFRFYLDTIEDSEKYDAANTHRHFLSGVFWEQLLLSLEKKEALYKDDFNMDSDRMKFFKVRMRPYTIDVKDRDYEADLAHWKMVEAREQQDWDLKEKARNLNKSLDELDAVEVELTQDEKAAMREEKRKRMLQMLGMMSDDVFFLDNHMNTSYEEVEAMYKKAGGE